MMKYLLLALTTLLPWIADCSLEAKLIPGTAYQFEVTSSSDQEKSVIVIEGQPVGIITKNFIPLCTRYAFDQLDGSSMAVSVWRHSMGSDLTARTAIDFYDANWLEIGSITGYPIADSCGKLDFYNDSGELRCVSYIDQEASEVRMIDPKDESRVIAILTWDDELKRCQVELYSMSTLDLRMVNLFAAIYFDSKLNP